MKFLRDVMIPMPDGVHLAANIWLPDEPGRYPALLTYLPYTKELCGGFYSDRLVPRGYAVVLADFRGTGNSEGINPSFVDPIEREDGYHMVEWLAAQDWCDGNVGVWGISYGGITAMSIASAQPPHLKAIIPISGTFDNFEYLLQPHGTQGMLVADMDLGAHMAARNLMPPILPDAAGQWKEKWRQRLESNTPWILDWHGAPPAADWWLRRRIPLEKINVPTFAISGWRDIYNGVMFDVFEKVDAPRKVLMGDWKHITPDESFDEMLRWWDKWLKGIDNKIETEPPVQIYVQGARQWRSENEWPIARTQMQRWYFDAGRVLTPAPSTPAAHDDYEYDPCVGVAYIAYNESRDWIPIPDDASADDNLSLAYTSAPLEAAMEITGTPVAHIFLSASISETNLVAKLCRVSVDGKSIVLCEGRVSTARSSAHDESTPLAPNEIREIVLPLRPTAFELQNGERLRLCLAGADFPEMWPTPEPYTMQVFRGGEYSSYCELPVVPPQVSSTEPPLACPPLPHPAPCLPEWGEHADIVHHDLKTGAVSYETSAKMTTFVEGVGVEYSHHVTASVEKTKPHEANFQARTEYSVHRPDCQISTVTKIVATLDCVTVEAEIELDGEPYFQRRWSKNAK